MMIEIWKENFKAHRLHFTIWSIFIMYESLVIGLTYKQFGHPATYAVHYTLIILLFYAHALLSLPWGLRVAKHAWWRLPAVIVLELAVFICCSYLFDLLLLKAHILKDSARSILDLQYDLKTVYRGLYFMGFGTGYYFLETYLKEKKRTNELEKQRLKDTIERQKMLEEMGKAQNAFLLSQINPHFFFNTLDFLYQLVEFNTPVAANAINTLGTMMRFAIDADKMGDFILLGKEIEQVDNLIYLNQLRDKMDVRFIAKDDVMSFHLIPLVLLTLAENIFKHGNLKSGNEASMHIYIDEAFFYVETDNAINTAVPPRGAHTGLKNTEKRLSFAYGKDIFFQYGPDHKGRFQVRLRLPLAAVENPRSLKAAKGIDKESLHAPVDQKKIAG